MGWDSLAPGGKLEAGRGWMVRGWPGSEDRKLMETGGRGHQVDPPGETGGWCG